MFDGLRLSVVVAAEVLVVVLADVLADVVAEAVAGLEYRSGGLDTN